MNDVQQAGMPIAGSQPGIASIAPLLVAPGAEWLHYEALLGQCNEDVCKLLPDFLIVSPPRTGTTWVADLLRCHADVFIPKEKELHYFDWNWKSARLSEYARWFAEAGGKLKGDATPTYALLPNHVIAAIKRLKPALKLIVLPRWPTARAWSQLKHSIAHGEDLFRGGPRNVALCSDKKKLAFLLSDYCRASSDYHAILARWTRHFDPSSIFVEYFERAVSEPHVFFRRLLAFLALDPPRELAGYPLHGAVNVGSLERAPAWFRAAAQSSTALWQRNASNHLSEQWGLAPAWPTEDETYRDWPVLVCETTDRTRIAFDGTEFSASGLEDIASPYLGDISAMLDTPSLRSHPDARALEDLRLGRTLDRLLGANGITDNAKWRLRPVSGTPDELGQRLPAIELTLGERDKRLIALEASMTERSERLAALEATSDERGDRLLALEASMAERSERLTALAVTLDERSARLVALQTSMAERSERLAALEATLDEQRQRLTANETTSNERSHRLESLERTVDEREKRLDAFESTLGEKDRRLDALETALHERHDRFTSLKRLIFPH